MDLINKSRDKINFNESLEILNDINDNLTDIKLYICSEEKFSITAGFSAPEDAEYLAIDFSIYKCSDIINGKIGVVFNKNIATEISLINISLDDDLYNKISNAIKMAIY